MELIQVATLIHDDFVDQDAFRRDRPAVWTLEGARRAVLIGDVIFASAIKMMSDLSREDGVTISHAIVQVSQGALHEPLDPLALVQEIEAGRVSDQTYKKIIHLKTGILFGTACRLGAIAAEADDHLRKKSYRYGLRIGEAYQIADDLKEVKQHLLKGSIHVKWSPWPRHSCHLESQANMPLKPQLHQRSCHSLPYRAGNSVSPRLAANLRNMPGECSVIKLRHAHADPDSRSDV